LFLAYQLYFSLHIFTLPLDKMKFSYLAFALATFITWCAAQNSASYDAFVAACQHNSINPAALNTGYRYAIYDYSPSRGGGTDCIVGFHHIRLVVGNIVPINGGLDFQAKLWDLIINRNNEADWNTEDWRADWHLNDDDAWVPTRAGHTYAMASRAQVKTGYSDDFINNIGTSKTFKNCLMCLLI
jgi:hypothetical protein